MTRDDPVVTAAKAGDPDAWRELYRAHAGRLLRWLERRDDHGHAEDLAAEAWLTAASKIADFRGDVDQFAGWLFAISRNLESNVRRREARRATSPADDLEVLASPILPSHEETVAIDDWVRVTLAQLPSRERDVLTCSEVLGMDGPQTAAALGISAVAVRVARHRGLKRLRALGQPA
ncbi:RNA polymerase sigma factor [Nocardioides sp. Kera G14]|uniref:RNA polymerase sigma factor n=1 Tax=Nocardioides sp. Kera G14 TaxID=2884264 RepID=UPI001D12F788|nr:sigma-70 family RNA polymerase sigma factor [Nocardioides sp. Kera G14]UDY24465.1 sigma-70 family RNA polymerase sigma factor [Nocardioides sp. Kera G14]